MSSSSQIEDLRHQIDDLDEALVELLLKRIDLSQQVQALKVAQGLQVYSPDREAQIVKRLKARFPNVPAHALDGIYREIFNWMRPRA